MTNDLILARGGSEGVAIFNSRVEMSSLIFLYNCLIHVVFVCVVRRVYTSTLTLVCYYCCMLPLCSPHAHRSQGRR